MVDCHAMKESMPLLLTESLDHSRRELTHQHIESCAACTAEWNAYKETWSLLGELPEVEPPARVRDRVLAEIEADAARGRAALHANVVPFRPRWLAQAAAVVVLVGASYYAGHRTHRVELAPTEAKLQSVRPFSIAETRTLSATEISPNIEGRPNIQNVQFVDSDATDHKIGLSFDVTSRYTVTGSPTDKSMVRLLSYVLEKENSNMSPSRSRAIEWVKQTYSDPQNAEPEIASALAKVLRSDSHEGVRLSAAETLKTLPGGTAQTRLALIDALKSDPNAAVRIKAVEALANMARNAGGQMDPAMLDTLRSKASQEDENLYVRVKAAEALSNFRPQ